MEKSIIFNVLVDSFTTKLEQCLKLQKRLRTSYEPLFYEIYEIALKIYEQTNDKDFKTLSEKVWITHLNVDIDAILESYLNDYRRY